MRLTAGDKAGKKGALMMLGLDNFKMVNDSFGHETGDRVLAEVGRVIRNSFRGADVAGRVGGDEFMIFVQDVDAEEAAQLAERISAQVGELPNLPDVTLSIGIALFPTHGKTFAELYRAADTALYRSKKGGKATYHVYAEG